MKKVIFILLYMRMSVIHSMEITNIDAVPKLIGIPGSVLKNKIKTLYVKNMDDSEKRQVIFLTEKNFLYCCDVEETKSVLDQNSFTLKHPSYVKDDVRVIGNVINVVEKDSAPLTILDRLRKIHTGILQPHMLYAKKNKNVWQGYGLNMMQYSPKDINFFIHNTEIMQLYGEYFPYNSGYSVAQAVVVGGSEFPSISLWKQRIKKLTDQSVGKSDILYEAEETVKKYPGYYLIAVHYNRIVYVKDGDRNTLLKRLLFKSTPHRKGTLHVHTLIDSNGQLSDLEKGIAVGSVFLPISGGFVPGAVNDDCIVHITQFNKMYVYAKDPEAKSWKQGIEITNMSEAVSNPFLVVHENETYVFWFTQKKVHYVKSNSLLKEKKFEIKSAMIPFHGQEPHAFTYDNATRSFYYVIKKQSDVEQYPYYIKNITVAEIMNISKAKNEESDDE